MIPQLSDINIKLNLESFLTYGFGLHCLVWPQYLLENHSYLAIIPSHMANFKKSSSPSIFFRYSSAIYCCCCEFTGPVVLCVFLPALFTKQQAVSSHLVLLVSSDCSIWNCSHFTGQLKWMKVRIKYLVKLSENFWKILSLSNSNFSDWKIKIKEKYKLWIVFDKVLQWVQYLYENFKLNLSFWSQ